MNRHLRILFAALLLSVGTLSARPNARSIAEPAARPAQPSAESGNPLLAPSDAPFGAPRLDRIHAADFPQAIASGIRTYEATVDSVRAVAPEAATFGNVIVRLNRAQERLRKTQAVLNYLRYGFGNDSLRRLYETTAPAVTEATDRTAFDPRIFACVRALYDRRDAEEFDSLQRRAIVSVCRSYVARGTLLDEAQQRRLTAINTSLALMRARFGQHLVKAGEEYVLFVSDSNALKGIPANARQRMARRAWEKNRPWEWAVGFGDYSTVMNHARDRSLRERLYRDYAARCASGGDCDNRQLMADILDLRLEKARLLGRTTYAELAIAGNMASGPAEARALLERLLAPAAAEARRECDEIEAYARAEQGAGFVVEPWDFTYYSKRMADAHFGRRLERVHEYLLLDNVLGGVFRVAERLYGVKMVRRDDIPVNSPDVAVFEVKEHDGVPLGLLYLDCFARKGKRSGAWTSLLRPYTPTDTGGELPLVTIHCNYMCAPQGRPQWLSLSQVRVLFHEAGHALAQLMARGPYPQVTGTRTPDMAELPSQLMEHWAWEPETMRTYMRHYRSGKQIPEELIGLIGEGQRYRQGARLAASYTLGLLDQAMHGITEPITAEQVAAFSDSLRSRYGVPHAVPLTDPTAFNHLFAGPYGGQYYAYAWASVLDTDAFAAFTETGDPYNPAVASRFRRCLLEQIGYAAATEQYVRFRGRTPDPAALLRRHGLQETDATAR